RLERGEASVALGPLELEAGATFRPLRQGDLRGGAGPSIARAAPRPLELLVLAAGRAAPALRDPAVVAAIDGALDRRRLAQRYAGSEARAARTLLGDERDTAAAPNPGARHRPAQHGLHAMLLVPEGAAVSEGFAERVQLDL